MFSTFSFLKIIWGANIYHQFNVNTLEAGEAEMKSLIASAEQMVFRDDMDADEGNCSSRGAGKHIRFSAYHLCFRHAGHFCEWCKRKAEFCRSMSIIIKMYIQVIISANSTYNYVEKTTDHVSGQREVRIPGLTHVWYKLQQSLSFRSWAQDFRFIDILKNFYLGTHIILPTVSLPNEGAFVYKDTVLWKLVLSQGTQLASWKYKIKFLFPKAYDNT